MPYILKEVRSIIDPKIDALVAHTPATVSPGNLNYTITKILLSTKPGNYTAYNELIGVLECIKQELYRRAVAPYEDRKIADPRNGDVYE